MNTLSVGEMIRFGWETFKKRPWFFIGVCIIIGILSGISSQLTGTLSTEEYLDGGKLLVGIVAVLVGFAVSTLVKMGEIALFLKAHDAPESAEILDLWAPKPFWTYLVASIVLGVIVLVGLILLIIPGVIWALKYMFVPYLVMDRKLGVSAALTESARITDGHKWQLLVFILALAGLNILGALCLLVGLLISIPVTSLAFVHAYRTLASSAQSGTPTAA